MNFKDRLKRKIYLLSVDKDLRSVTEFVMDGGDIRPLVDEGMREQGMNPDTMFKKGKILRDLEKVFGKKQMKPYRDAYNRTK